MVGLEKNPRWEKGVLDINGRTERKMAKLLEGIDYSADKLLNEKFISNAPKEIIDREKQRMLGLLTEYNWMLEIFNEQT